MNINPNIQKLVDGMRSAGVPTTMSVAVGMAVEHALACPDFATQYGTVMQEALTEFLEKVA